MAEVEWEKLTAPELRELAEADAIVLLPVASTEQHGPHLSTGVDTFLCGEACRRTARLVAAHRPIVVAPTVWMGLAEHHVAFGGTFSLSLSTWHALLRDLCRSILNAGFKRICIVNGHGGNMAALAALTTDLTREIDAQIATTSYWNVPHASGAFEAVLETQKGVQHACEAETSMMMAVKADCVRAERLADAKGPNRSMSTAIGRTLMVWRSFSEITPTGVLGDATCATPEKGEQLLDIASRQLADELITGAHWT
ncbi:MAG: creatininase family protein [Hyphomicrobiaceae bacterium]